MEAMRAEGLVSEIYDWTRTDSKRDQIHGRPIQPKTQRKIGRYHRTTKNVEKLDRYYSPEVHGKAIEKFVNSCNNIWNRTN